MSRPGALPFVKHLLLSAGDRNTGESWWYRAREDQRACAVLGIDRSELGFVDALYRRSMTGARRYRTAGSLNGSPHPADAALVESIAHAVQRIASKTNDIVCFPMAIGNHVDHQLTALAGLRLQAAGQPVVFYKDFFYQGAATLGQSALADAQRFVLRLSDDEVRKKQAALAEYKTQVVALYGDVPRMQAAVARSESIEQYLVPANASASLLQRMGEIAEPA